MNLYMLDTNTASCVIKGTPPSVRERLLELPMASICISAITRGELLHGVAGKPEAIHLPQIVREFLLRVEILAWDSSAAEVYGTLRAECERDGTPLGNLDMLIAAHSVSADAVLVTHDRAFYRLQDKEFGL